MKTTSDSAQDRPEIAGTGTIIAALAAVGLLLAAAAVARASTTITPESVNHLQHLIDCASALVADPAAHEQYCAPGHDVFVNGTTGFAADHYYTTSAPH